jgi:hypothetical protein
MSIPKVTIRFQNGLLGNVSQSADGLLGIVINGTPEGDFALGETYSFRTMADVTAAGITEGNNPTIVKALGEFFAEAGEGMRIYLIAAPDATTMTTMLSTTQAYARKLIEDTNGEVKGLIVMRQPAPGYTPTIQAGLDSDVHAAITAAQTLGEWATTQKYAPVFVLIEGRSFAGNASALTDLTTMTKNRVGVVIGDTDADGAGAAMGLIAGRIAKIPVSRNIGRVKDGALAAEPLYIAGVKAENADVEAINDKGYITFRTYVGRAGYFFADEPLATLPSDDYKYLALRRTIDKAYRIAYDTLVDEILDEVATKSDGTIVDSAAAAYESMLESAIAKQMTAYGELSVDDSDDSDKGVKASVDRTNDVRATGVLNITLSVRPYGYARYINVELGFLVTEE